MHIRRIFRHGKSQAVRLPAEYRFESPEVRVTRIGSMVIIYPAAEAWSLLQSAIGTVSDDFARPTQGVAERSCEDLDPTPIRRRGGRRS